MPRPPMTLLPRPFLMTGLRATSLTSLTSPNLNLSFTAMFELREALPHHLGLSCGRPCPPILPELLEVWLELRLEVMRVIFAPPLR